MTDISAQTAILAAKSALGSAASVMNNVHGIRGLPQQARLELQAGEAAAVKAEEAALTWWQLHPESGSEPSGPPAPPTVPNAPTNVTATPGNGEAPVTWTAPVDNGVTIHSYTIEMTPSGGLGSSVNFPAPATSFVVTELTNGTSYVFKMYAENDTGGAGAVSLASNPVVPEAGPTFVPDLPSEYLSQIASTPTFTDDFPGTTLNSSKWNPTYSAGGFNNNVNTLAANVAVDNGVQLKLSTAANGACIDTHNKFSFNHGFLQGIATAPLAPDGGIANWIAIYSAMFVVTGATGITELDPLENLNIDGSADYSLNAQPRITVHGKGGAGDGLYSLSPTATSGNPADGKSYAGTEHTYGVLWIGNTVTFFFDGVEVGSVTNSEIGTTAMQDILIVHGNDEQYAGQTVVGAVLKVAQIAYWPAA